MTPATIAGLLAQNAGAWVELFVLDATAQGGSITRFHAGTNSLSTAVVWQGNTYQPFPIEMEGFEWNGQGLPRPKARLANVSGLISALVRDYADLIGAKVTRKRTMVQFLDAVNFPGGTNPSADPTSYLPDEVYFITQKTREDKYLVEFELGTPLDLQGVSIPRRQIVGPVCGWRTYRGEGCGYAGGPVADDHDNPTTNPALDKCSRKISGCKLRFGENGVLPFGGFPAASLVRY